MASRIAARLKGLNVELPRPRSPAANYVPTVLSGNQLYVAGQVCAWGDELGYVSQLGTEISTADGQKAARICALNILAQSQAALGDLDRVRRCIKLNVFVRTAPTFTDHSQVADGASDLVVEVFEEAGRHARSTIGVVQLPRGACVEVDATFEVTPLSCDPPE